MKKEPQLLVWNYTPEEKKALDELLKELGAPCAVTIGKNRAHIPIMEILHTQKSSDIDFEHDEKAILFYNIPQKGVFFLIDRFKSKGLPPSLYAMITEHSIQWPFSKLLEHLIEERKIVEKMEADRKGKKSSSQRDEKPSDNL